MGLSPEELEKILSLDTDQDEKCSKLARSVYKIHETQKLVTKLEHERNLLMADLAESGYPINRIAGIAGIDRHKVSNIVGYISAQKRVDPEYMDDPPDWFGK